MSNSSAVTLPTTDSNVADLLRQVAAVHPDRAALLGTFGRRTWGELDRAVSAGALALRGVTEPGDRMLVRLPVGPEAVLAQFAVSRAGLVVAPLSPDPSRAAEAHTAAERLGAVGIIGPDPVGRVHVTADDVRAWWDAPAVTADAVGSGEDLAWLAGAGSDRPAMLSHRALISAVHGVLSAPSLNLRAEDRAVQVLPLHHLSGWVTAFLPLTAVGGAAVLPDHAEPGEWIGGVLALIREHRVTVIPAAPGLYRRLSGAVGVERALSSVRLMTSAATPLDPEDLAALRATLGQSIWEGYGVSEAASVVTTSLMTSAPRPGSVGRPVAGVQLRILDDGADDGADLIAGAEQAVDLVEPKPVEAPPAAEAPADAEAVAAEEESTGVAEPVETAPDEPQDSADAADEPQSADGIGDIAIRGGTLFSGYWPDGSDGPDADGWFVTGDVGYLDDRGELHLVDRSGESFTVAGFTVYPREVEDALTEHPYVRDAAVVAVPDRGTNRIVAVLVAQRGTRPTDTDLAEHLSTRLPLFKRPAEYVLVDRMPRTEVGRIDRRAVAALVDPSGQVAAFSPRHARGTDESDADLF